MNMTSDTVEKTDKSTTAGLSTDDTIAMFKAMRPSKEVLMGRDMETMYSSVVDARKRDVSEQQIIATLKLKWPGAHTATIIKVINAELERRLKLGEQVECKPFGSPRKPKIHKAAKTGKTVDYVPTSQAVPDTTEGDQHEVSV
jgi:hypothetical protein